MYEMRDTNAYASIRGLGNSSSLGGPLRHGAVSASEGRAINACHKAMLRCRGRGYERS